MASVYLSQIVPFGCNFAPRGFAFCNGQILSIAQNTALFSLLGTTYGGNGQTTFALPNLQSRVPVHFGTGPGLSNYALGQTGGGESVTLTASQLPAHTHTATFNGSTSTLNSTAVKATTQIAAAGSLLGKTVDNGGTTTPLIYAPAGSAAGAALGGLNVAGTVTVNPNVGGQPTSVIQPYLAINFCIALQGIFPSRN
ncbi:MAG: tail fiber protein [Pseudomonadota bacterium]|nr:tail fiber protein [Pseudomonadota bacterium]